MGDEITELKAKLAESEAKLADSEAKVAKRDVRIAELLLEAKPSEIEKCSELIQNYRLSQPQIRTAEECFKHFETYHSGLLRALVQAGKTGAYLCLGLLMIQRKNYGRIVLCCGSAECELRDKLKAEIEGTLGKYSKYFKVYFQHEMKTDLKSDLEQYRKNKEKVLIIVDESHYAQDKDNTRQKVFDELGIGSITTGSVSKENQEFYPKLLTVSATPYSEVHAIDKQEQHKFVCDLEVTDEYRGFEKFMREGKVQKLDVDNPNLLNELVPDNKERKFGIIRMHGKESIQNLQDKCRQNNINCVIFDQKGWNNKKSMRSEQLKNKPDRFTVVIIKGLLRMGSVIYKSHIKWVFETGKNGNTDTVEQALPGRVSGYPSEENGKFDGIIYLSEDLIEEVNFAVDSGKALKANNLVTSKKTKDSILFNSKKQLSIPTFAVSGVEYVNNPVICLKKGSLPPELNNIKSVKTEKGAYVKHLCNHLNSLLLESKPFEDELTRLYDGDEGVLNDFKTKVDNGILSVRCDFEPDNLQKASLKRSHPGYRKWSRDQGSDARDNQVEHLFVYSDEKPSSGDIWLYFSTKLVKCCNTYYSPDPIYDANILPKSSFSREDSKVLKKSRKPCKCGSISHMRISHHSCPLNKKNLVNNNEPSKEDVVEASSSSRGYTLSPRDSSVHESPTLAEVPELHLLSVDELLE